MQISKNSAMQIITEISQIIDQHVNIMDYTGCIIASTNEKRIGTLHEGAKKVIDESLSELVVYSDDQYKGTKRGINWPLIFMERCVGVIGITGEREKIEKYGQIIKKMTEILMRDAYSNQQKILDRKLKKRFIEEWMFSSPSQINQEVVERGLMLEIDITVPRRVIIATPIIIGEGEISKLEYYINQVEKSVREVVLQDNKNLFLRIGSKLIALVSQQEDEKIKQLVDHLSHMIINEYGLKLGIGIDNNIGNYKLIHTSYVNAGKALKACLSSTNNEKKFYNDINIEIFISEIPKHLKEEYIKRVFKNCDTDEIEHFIEIIEALFEMDGSINRAADKLFMHKNTLQYRLQTIAKKTNLDPRQLKNAAVFYIAIYFYFEVNDF